MKNKLFEEKIRSEIIADCNDDYDMKMAWFYYLQDDMEFPFIASVKLKNVKKKELLKEINVIGLSMGDSDIEKVFDMKVEAEFEGYIIEFPIAKLQEAKASESTIEIIEIWKYWVKE